MKFNPFRPGAIAHPGMFAGRIDEIQELEKCLFQTQNGNPENFLVHGERGIGKSSLLFIINSFATGVVKSLGEVSFKFVTVNVELQKNDKYPDVLRKVAHEFFKVIDKNESIKGKAKDLWNFVSKWEILGVKYNRDTTPSELMLEELVDKIAAVAETLSKEGAGIYIFIDEADKPTVEAELGQFIKAFTERLTKQGITNVGLGIIGITDVIDKIASSHQSAIRVLKPIELRPLLPDDQKQVVLRGLAAAKEKNGVESTISNEALKLIAQLSEGYPYFIQQYAHSAFDCDEDNHIDVDDVTKGLNKKNGALEKLGQQFFENMYTDEIRSDDYRKVLQVAAQNSPNHVTRAQIISESKLKDAAVNNALTALKKRGSIVPIDGKVGHYKLPSQSFALWIKAFKIASETKA